MRRFAHGRESRLARCVTGQRIVAACEARGAVSGNRRGKVAARSRNRGFRPAPVKVRGGDSADLPRWRPWRRTAPGPPQAKAGASPGDRTSWVGPATTPVPSRPWSASKADRRPIPRIGSRVRRASAGDPLGGRASRSARPKAAQTGRAKPASKRFGGARSHGQRLPPTQIALGLYHGLSRGGHPPAERKASFRGSQAASRSRRHLMHRLRRRRSQRDAPGVGRSEEWADRKSTRQTACRFSRRA